MGRRSTCTATISFGLVSIPVKFYVAASASENVSFCLLSPNDKRVKQQYVEVDTGDVVEYGAMKRGFEHEKNKILSFTKEEIKALEEKNTGSIEIHEFVNADQVDALHVEKSHHLSPGKGGDKAYKLLAAALTKLNRVAIAQHAARGKVNLVVIRPYKDGLVIHQMYYANEIRDFESDAANVPVSEAETNMACSLIDALTVEKYDNAKYSDKYQERVKEAIAAKLAGTKVEDKSEPVNAPVTDLFAALKASLENASKKAS